MQWWYRLLSDEQRKAFAAFLLAAANIDGKVECIQSEFEMRRNDGAVKNSHITADYYIEASLDANQRTDVSVYCAFEVESGSHLQSMLRKCLLECAQLAAGASGAGSVTKRDSSMLNKFSSDSFVSVVLYNGDGLLPQVFGDTKTSYNFTAEYVMRNELGDMITPNFRVVAISLNAAIRAFQASLFNRPANGCSAAIPELDEQSAVLGYLFANKSKSYMPDIFKRDARLATLLERIPKQHGVVVTGAKNVTHILEVKETMSYVKQVELRAERVERTLAVERKLHEQELAKERACASRRSSSWIL